MNDGYRFLLDADLDFWMKLASPDPVTYEMRDGGDSLMLFISSCVSTWLLRSTLVPAGVLVLFL